ncbi:midnolin homolog [Lingula anatina]|uniref:Midnolin homolog n=1 Tax=Lingula anatina TaxID=7574 RepID=A0A1S3JFI5_LINAN|nr:midnolin homolog [Lingula anatina]|eukprot:XP_013409098.1 midnolin homolog [Lingula anatina]
MERDIAGPTSSTESLLCSNGQSTSTNLISIQICPSTGGQFDLQVTQEFTVDDLKRAIGKKLKVTRDKISILFREKILKDGTLREHSVVDGSRITLLPHVESGLMNQRAEQSVLQALENLSDGQVNDFLSGKSPLTLAMRLGDHMMFVQLQLSTTPPKKVAKRKRTSANQTSSSVSSAGTASMGTSNGSTAAISPASQLLYKDAQSTLPSNTLPPPSSSSSSTATDITPSSLNKPPYASSSQTMTVKEAPPINTLPILDKSLLAEASRNLSKRLKELSQASAEAAKNQEEDLTPPPSPPVTTNTMKPTSSSLSTSSTTTSTTSSSSSVMSSLSPAMARDKQQGAIIESMQHHGQGVYSGTFSGTLNPALQDRDGKPKKSISTIIHILNDLLGATPQYRASSGKQSSRKAERMMSAMATKPNHTPENEERLQQENQTIRGKMERLQQMMEERRQRRQQRRESRGPYPMWSPISPHMPNSPEKEDGSSMEVDANLETMTDNVNDSNDNQYSVAQKTVVA